VAAGVGVELFFSPTSVGRVPHTRRPLSFTRRARSSHTSTMLALRGIWSSAQNGVEVRPSSAHPSNAAGVPAARAPASPLTHCTPHQSGRSSPPPSSSSSSSSAQALAFNNNDERRQRSGAPVQCGQNISWQKKFRLAHDHFLGSIEHPRPSLASSFTDPN
jgi:hypothetical protein